MLIKNIFFELGMMRVLVKICGQFSLPSLPTCKDPVLLDGEFEGVLGKVSD